MTNPVGQAFYYWATICNKEVTMCNFQQIRMYKLINRIAIIFQSTIYQKTNSILNRPYIIGHTMSPQIPSIKFSRRLAVASSRQFSAYEVGLLND